MKRKYCRNWYDMYGTYLAERKKDKKQTGNKQTTTTTKRVGWYIKKNQVQNVNERKKREREKKRKRLGYFKVILDFKNNANGK